MKTLRLLALLLMSTGLALAADLQNYTIRLQAQRDGSGQGLATLQVKDLAAGTLSLPLGFAAAEELHLEGAPAGVRLEASPHNGMTALKLQIPQELPGRTTLRWSFRLKQVFQNTQPKPGEKSTLPAGSRLFRHAFVNTQEDVLGAYRLEFLLPEGFMFQTIREQLPKLAKSEVEPRVRLDKLDGCQSATLQCSKLMQGDGLSMVLEVVPVRKSWAWLVAGLTLAGLYLYYFRDLVAAPERR